MGGCYRPVEEFARDATRSATWPRTPRSSHPPYLFKKDGSGQLAPRPTISSAPSAAGYGSQIQIGTPDASSIQKMALVRLGSVTHDNNMEQRYVPLKFTPGTGMVARPSRRAPMWPRRAITCCSSSTPPAFRRSPRWFSSTPRSPAAPAVASNADRNQPKVSGERQPSRGDRHAGSGQPDPGQHLHQPQLHRSPAATGTRSRSRERHHDRGSRRLIDPDQCHGRRHGRRLRLLQLHLLCRVDRRPTPPSRRFLPDYEQHHGELRLHLLGGRFDLRVPLRRRRGFHALQLAEDLHGAPGGRPSFRVRATDAAGNTDPTPADAQCHRRHDAASKRRSTSGPSGSNLSANRHLQLLLLRARRPLSMQAGQRRLRRLYLSAGLLRARRRHPHVSGPGNRPCR